MAQADVDTIRIEATDASGQRVADVSGLSVDASIAEVVEGLVGQMELPRHDGSGRPLRYQANLVRERRHLRDEEMVGRALQEDDRIVLEPNIDAGSRPVV